MTRFVMHHELVIFTLKITLFWVVNFIDAFKRFNKLNVHLSFLRFILRIRKFLRSFGILQNISTGKPLKF